MSWLMVKIAKHNVKHSWMVHVHCLDVEVHYTE